MGKGVDWTDLVNLTYYRDMWHTDVNTIMNLQAPYTTGYFLTIRGTLKLLKNVCSM
jgi:hypothetical protein